MFHFWSGPCLSSNSCEINCIFSSFICSSGEATSTIDEVVRTAVIAPAPIVCINGPFSAEPGRKFAWSFAFRAAINRWENRNLKLKNGYKDCPHCFSPNCKCECILLEWRKLFKQMTVLDIRGQPDKGLWKRYCPQGEVTGVQISFRHFKWRLWKSPFLYFAWKFLFHVISDYNLHHPLHKIRILVEYTGHPISIRDSESHLNGKLICSSNV